MNTSNTSFEKMKKKFLGILKEKNKKNTFHQNCLDTFIQRMLRKLITEGLKGVHALRVATGTRLFRAGMSDDTAL